MLGQFTASCIMTEVAFASSLKSIVLYDENERTISFG